MTTQTVTISADRLRLLYNDQLELVGKVKSRNLELKACELAKSEALAQEPVVMDSGPSLGFIMVLLLGAVVAGGVGGFLLRDRL